MRDTDSRPPHSRLSVFALCAILFILSQFWRVSSAVIAGDLSRDLGLSPGSLGLLGGAFFYSFCLAQLPMGPLLDRYGPRVIMSALACIGAASAILFAFSQDPSTAILARAGIGVGMAAALMGSYKLFTILFPPHDFATVAGILISVGQLGCIGATVPLVWLSDALGWRVAFVFMGILTVIPGIVLYFVLRHEAKVPNLPVMRDFFIPLRTVLTSGRFWRIAPLGLASYGTLITAQGLWGGPYLMHVYGLSKAAAGSVLLAIPVGVICGSPLWGRFSDCLAKRKSPILFGQVAMLVVYSSLAIDLQLPCGLLVLQFWLLGVCFGSNNILYVHVKETFSLPMAGTALTGLNFFIILGAAVFQHLMGAVINHWPASQSGIFPVVAYQWGFGLGAALLAVALFIYTSSEDTSPLEASLSKI